MKKAHRMKTLLIAFALSMLSASFVSAQEYPLRPVKIVVPYPAGGSNDIAARIVAQHLADKLKQPFIIENRGGGGGNIGMEAVAASDPDGYTLLLSAPGPLTANHNLFKNMSVDPTKAFAPIALVGSTPILVVAHPSLPAKDIKEFVALAKSKPGQINYGSQGNGSSSHLSTELLKMMAEINLTHVPYKGAAPAMNDLIAGHVPMLMDSMPGVIAQVKAGRIIPLAIGSKRRSKLLPDVPTVDETVAKGYEAFAWYGFVAPVATPKPVVEILRKATAEVIAMPEVQKRFEELGIEPGEFTGEAFGDFMKAETAKWKKVIEVSGARVD